MGPADEAYTLNQALTDPELFAPIYEKYALRIYRYCLRRIQGIEEAEDLTSLIFTKAIDKLASFRGGSVAAWLFQIAHNEVINYLKKTSRQAQSTPLGQFDAETEPVLTFRGEEILERLITLENHEQLARLVAALPDDNKELLALRFAGGLSAKDIGMVVHKSENSVRVSLHRVIQKLRRDYRESQQD